jgi:hypothetical protein
MLQNINGLSLEKNRQQLS